MPLQSQRVVMTAIPERTRADLVEAGFVFTHDDGVVVAEPADRSPELLPTTGRDGGDRRRIELHPADEPPEPWWIVATLADAVRRDRGAAFVPVGTDAPAVAERIADVLSSPFAVASEDDDGARTFYESPDRVHLDGGGLALAESRFPSFEWREESPEGATNGRESAAGRKNDPDRRSGTDRKRLVLTDGDREVAILDGVDRLRCPGPAREDFPYAYRREDGVFAVRAREGRLVGTFAGVRAMRDRGFAPVPAPVVPEFEFADAVFPPRNAWAVLEADGRVTNAAGKSRLDGDR